MSAKDQATRRAKWIPLLALLVLFLGEGSLWAAEIYRWTDEAGVIHFTDSYTAIPEQYRSQVVPVDPSAGGTFSELPAVAPPPAALPEERPAPAVDAEGNTREYWQNRVRTWTEARNSAQAEIEDLTPKLERQRQKAVYLGIFARQKADDLQQALTEAEAKRDEAQLMLVATLPEEAQRVGAPLEWLTLAQ